MKSGAGPALALVVLATLGAAQPSRAPQRPPPGGGSAGQAGRPTRAAEPTVPFSVGESLTYDVSWSSVLVAATATTTVREKRPSFNATAYYIVAEGRPVPMLARLYTLYYKMDSLLDSVTLLSQRGSLYSEEGSDRRMSATRFDRAARRASFERQTESTDRVEYAVPPQTQDGLAVLYTLRGRSLKPGDRASIPVADSGSLYTVRVEVGALEQVRVPAGRYAAWTLKGLITDAQGQMVWNNIVVWISNDARRLPVKMQADLPVGSFVLALREAR